MPETCVALHSLYFPLFLANSFMLPFECIPRNKFSYPMKHVCRVFSSSSSWNPLIRIVHRISFEWYAAEDNKKNARQTLVIEKTSALDMQQCLQAMCIIRVLWRIGLLFSHVYNSWMDVAYTLIQFDSSRICNFFCDLRALRAAYWTIYECVCSLSFAMLIFSLFLPFSVCVFISCIYYSFIDSGCVFVLRQLEHL